MAQNTSQQGEKKPADRTRWEAIRPNVMRQRWFERVVALENSIDKLDELLSPRTESHVVRLKRTPAERRVALEDALLEVEKTCRHMRMEHQHDGERDERIVLPFLPQLEQSPSVVADLRARGLLNDLHASTQRMQVIDKMRFIIRDYAKAIGGEVTRDSLYNAYRRDFHGMETEKFEAQPFVDHLKETSAQLRLLAMAHSMRKLARRLQDGSEPEITAAVSRFAKKLDGLHVGYDPRLRQWLECIGNSDSPMAARAAAKAEAAPWLEETGATILGHFTRERLLAAMEHDEALFLKPRSATPPTKADLYAIAGDAKESMTQLSYLSAERALNRLDGILETRWRDVEELYPNPEQSQGMSNRRGH